VTEDQETLRGILRALGAEESGFRKAGAWLTEKVGRLKLHLEGPAPGSLHQLEALEALALGILGKLALWRGLVVAGGIEALRGVDLGELQRRRRLSMPESNPGGSISRASCSRRR
jgi:hypothetical protein